VAISLGTNVITIHAAEKKKPRQNIMQHIFYKLRMFLLFTLLHFFWKLKNRIHNGLSLLPQGQPWKKAARSHQQAAIYIPYADTVGNKTICQVREEYV